MHKIFLTSLFSVLTTMLVAQPVTISDDKEWLAQQATLKNATEAAFIIRVGDVDNLNFGFPNGFDPFCGVATDVHGYPWLPAPDDLPGLDRILLSSKFNPNNPKGCNADGYSGSFDKESSRPAIISIDLSAVRDVEIKDAYLQLFVDDFQHPSMCSKYQLTLNGKRFSEGERIINAIDQTGPVSKLITIPIPEEFFGSFHTQDALDVYIDEVTGAADGFAIDFVRLLINRKRENACKGSIKGKVIDKATGKPIAKASVYLSDNTAVQSNDKGEFRMNDIPTGMEVVNASAPGYNDGNAIADIAVGDENNEVIIALDKGKGAMFDQKQLKVGESISLQNIQFDQSKAELRNTSRPELDKVAAFLLANPEAEIELSGHTSAEGDAKFNRILSLRRVKACKEYIVSKGIDPVRIITSGYGPDRPLAANDTEANRAKNRRVEMRLARL